MTSVKFTRKNERKKKKKKKTVLDRCDLLGIYPEGSRSPDGRIYRGLSGTVFFTHFTLSTILRVYITEVS
ncbi:hypothetical protein BT096_11730 [Corynebacterium diphtheriae]|nr:hypothetical protein BT096_11730 [Corynebacterium diphtheriae]